MIDAGAEAGGAQLRWSGPRVVVLISGRGSNLAALHRHAAVGPLLVGVITSRADAPGAAAAAAAGLPVAVVESRAFADRAAFDAALLAQLRAWSADWVVLAGFMHILGDAVLGAFHRRIVNIHPSLLPAFPGLRPHRQALAAGVTVSGCTVHLVEPGAVDGGPIVAQAEVPVPPGDTEETLAGRVLEAEHRLYAPALAALLGVADTRAIC
jgi:phosphoribosylglycinamide formyltransferase-1